MLKYDTLGPLKTWGFFGNLGGRKEEEGRAQAGRQEGEKEERKAGRKDRGTK